MEQKENFTSRMAALMGRLRREMNGAVVESMQRAGVKGMLNYGVSIPTIRTIAAEVGTDHPFACFLYRQQVRELRLAAASIADPQQTTLELAEEWIGGVEQLEILDELAMRLFSRLAEEHHAVMVDRWLLGSDPKCCYVALMTLNRTTLSQERVLAALLEALKHHAAESNVARAALAYCTFHYEAAARLEFPATRTGEFVKRELEALFG